MKYFCVHRERLPPFYGPVGHIGVPDDLRGKARKRSRCTPTPRTISSRRDHCRPWRVSCVICSERGPVSATTEVKWFARNSENSHPTFSTYILSGAYRKAVRRLVQVERSDSADKEDLPPSTFVKSKVALEWSWSDLRTIPKIKRGPLLLRRFPYLRTMCKIYPRTFGIVP